MEENLEDILRNGFLTWRKNLNIAVPFLLSSIINLLLIVIFITIIYFFLNPFQSSFATASYGRYSPLSSINWLLLLLDILLVIVGYTPFDHYVYNLFFLLCWGYRYVQKGDRNWKNLVGRYDGIW